MKILILDTETTGLQAPQACEIAYFPLAEQFLDFKSTLKSHFDSNFDFDFDLKLDPIFNSGFKPNKRIDPQASKVTGIYDKDVANCPSIDTFRLPEETAILVGHNISYDHKVLSYKDLANPINVSLVCTKELSQLAFQQDNIKNNKLTTLFEHFYPTRTDILENAHGAYQDCLMVYMLMYCILERLPAITSWEQLVELCSQGKKSYEELSELKKVITTLPFGKYRNVPIKDVPRDYLIWLSKQDISPPLANAIKLVLLGG